MTESKAEAPRIVASEWPIYQLDSFTTEAFCGNPAAVTLVPRGLKWTKEQQETLYKKMAMEMNLSETAYLETINDSDTFKTGTEFNLRWFTPTTEIPLCGHGTLATAHVLFHVLGNPATELSFNTLSGVLKVEREEGTAAGIRMSFPRNPAEPAADDDAIRKLVELTVGSTPVHEVVFSPGTAKLIIRLADAEGAAGLLAIKPNIQELPNVDQSALKHRVRGVSVTVKSDDAEYDFFSRYFAPWVGISEDPVNGSSHTALVPYWGAVLGKTKLTARMLSARRGTLRLADSADRVYMAGDVALVFEGTIRTGLTE